MYSIKQFLFNFKLDDASVFRHKNERRVKTNEEEMANEATNSNVLFEDVEIDDTGDDETTSIDKYATLSAVSSDQVQLQVTVENKQESFEEKELSENVVRNLNIKDDINDQDENERKDDTEDFQFPETSFEPKVSKM
jgi:hypothetical protein